jgi:2-oxoisovalerate ferredoxin oxidoreductase gamma subunit
VTRGMVSKGQIVVNSVDEKGAEIKKIGEAVGVSAFIVNANKIAVDLIGTPTVSTIMLGALASASGFVTADSLESTVRQRFHGNMADANAKMIRMGFKEVHKI